MPNLLLRFLAKSSLSAQPAHPTPQNTTAPAAANSDQNATSTLHRASLSKPLWADLDVFKAFKEFCDACLSEEAEKKRDPRAKHAVMSFSEQLEALSTTDLVQRVRWFLLHAHLPFEAGGAQTHQHQQMMNEEGCNTADVQNAFRHQRLVQRLQSIIAVHRTSIELLRQAAFAAEGDTASPSTVCVLTEVAMLLRPSAAAPADVSVLRERAARESESASHRAASKHAESVAGAALTQVIGTNLYTISSFLAASDAEKKDATSVVQQPSCKADDWRTEELIFPSLFYLISLTLDLAAAAATATATVCGSTGHLTKTAPKSLAALPCVLQEEGSRVLTCLLRMRTNEIRSRHRPQLGGSTSAAADAWQTGSVAAMACGWVVTHHLLRRLLPLLFVALPQRCVCHARSEKDCQGHDDDNTTSAEEDVRVGSEDASTNIEGRDGTDVDLVAWLADCLRHYAAMENVRHLDTSVATAHPAHRVAAGAPVPWQPLTAAVWCAACNSTSSHIYEGFQFICVLDLLRCLLQRLQRRSFSNAGNWSGSGRVESETKVFAPRLDARLRFFPDNCECVDRSQLLEYSSVLSPALKSLRESRGWRWLPSSLSEVVEALRIQLRSLDDTD